MPPTRPRSPARHCGPAALAPRAPQGVRARASVSAASSRIRTRSLSGGLPSCPARGRRRRQVRSLASERRFAASAFSY
eukprot:753840-Hanusia_phi.AAC.8